MSGYKNQPRSRWMLPSWHLGAAKLLLTALLTVGALGHVLTSAGPALASGAGTDTLGAGQALYAGQSLISANGEFRLTMQTDGNLVLYRYSGSGTPAHALWSTATNNHPGAWVTMQTDGNFVVYSAPPYHALWSTGTWGHSGANSNLKVQTDGNLIIAGGAGQLWTPLSNLRNAALYPGDLLKPGWDLTSSNGRYVVNMQKDGNLVIYIHGTSTVVWASKTANHAGAWAIMQGDGNFVVYSAGYLPAASSLWSSTTANHSGAYLTMQGDGHLVVRSASGRMLDSNPAYYTHYKGCKPFPVTVAVTACLDVGYWYNGLAGGINWATPYCYALTEAGWVCNATPGPPWWQWDSSAYDTSTGETGGYTAHMCQSAEWLPSELVTLPLMYYASLHVTVWRSGNLHFYATTSLGDCP